MATGCRNRRSSGVTQAFRWFMPAAVTRRPSQAWRNAKRTAIKRHLPIWASSHRHRWSWLEDHRCSRYSDSCVYRWSQHDAASPVEAARPVQTFIASGQIRADMLSTNHGIYEEALPAGAGWNACNWQNVGLRFCVEMSVDETDERAPRLEPRAASGAGGPRLLKPACACRPCAFLPSSFPASTGGQ